MNFNNNLQDTFFEQIVPIKKDGKSLAIIFGILCLAFFLIFLAFFYLTSVFFFFLFGIGFGAWWLISKLNVEYEYIITNGTIDIDKITNKSSRKRILTFELGGVTRLEKYSPAAVANIPQKELVFACNKSDPNAYLMVANRMGKGTVNVVFSPNDKIKSAVEKFAPKFIVNNVFKG